MIIGTNEIVKARIGEALDEEIQKNANVLQKREKWCSAINKFADMVSMTPEQRLVLQEVKEIFAEYNAAYSETVYRMGYSDGVVVGMEQESNKRISVLSVEDMTNLISVYDAVRQLKKVLLGSMDEHWKNAGAFSVFESIFDIIDNATCSKIKLLGEDESIEIVTNVLSDKTMRAEEKAKQLLGLK